VNYFFTEKAKKTCQVAGKQGFQSFDTNVACELNIDAACLLHELLMADHCKNYDKEIHIIDDIDVKNVINKLEGLFGNENMQKCFNKLIKKQYIKILK
jgi:hypothetical protein